jgi:LPXTG-motif cell wall-anchored protein
MNLNLNMNMKQIFGVATLLVGVVLLTLAYHASSAPVEQLSNALTGRYTDQTMWYLLLGIVAAATGGAFVLFGRRAS